MIHDCLSSVFNQSLKPFEVIVIDGSSTDDTLEKARRFPVKILIETEPASPANARNLGAEHAHGDLLLLMDADAVLDYDCLRRAVRYFQNPSVLALIPSQEAMMHTRLEKLQANWFSGTSNPIRTGVGTIAPVQFIRKDVFGKIKFDTSLGYGEDDDFHDKLQQLCQRESGKMVYAPDIKISVHFPHTLRELRSQYVWYGRTFMRYFTKHLSIKTTLNFGSLLMPAILLFLSAVAIILPELFSVVLIGFLLLVIRNIIACYRSRSIYLIDFLCFEFARSIFFLSGMLQSFFVKRIGR